DAPRHAEHGEDAAAAIVLERVVGLASEFEKHKFILSPPAGGETPLGQSARCRRYTFTPGAMLPLVAATLPGALDRGLRRCRRRLATGLRWPPTMEQCAAYRILRARAKRREP